MTDTLLALIPQYGPLLIASVVFLSCFGAPLPASMLVMAGGGFAAAGDLLLWQVILGGGVGFVLGDQGTYGLARRAGSPLIARLSQNAKRAAVIDRARSLLNKRGAVAVFLSRTVLSPLGPYVGYTAGAIQLGWAKFTTGSVAGAGVWASCYAMLGFSFADQITQVASLIGSGLGFVAAAACGLGGVWWLARSLRKARAQGLA